MLADQNANAVATKVKSALAATDVVAVAAVTVIKVVVAKVAAAS